MGLPMGDDCHKTISQPRFVSWNDDNTQFFNHTAKPYYLLPVEKNYHTIKRSYQNARAGNEPATPFQWCVEQINKSHSFTEGARHSYMVHLVRYCNLKGLAEYETLNGCLQFIQTDFPQTEIESIVRSILHQTNGQPRKTSFYKPLGSDYGVPEHQEQSNSSLKEIEVVESEEISPMQEIQQRA